MKSFFRFLSSLGFALFLIGALTVILITSTLMESALGTPFAQKIFYQAWWFDVFLGLFGVNILCSALSRWPYKKHHTGFVVTHAGILMLLVGSFLARINGVDGEMALYEGEKRADLVMSGFQLVVHTPDHKTSTYELKPSAVKKKWPVGPSDPGLRFYVHEVSDRVYETTAIEKGSESDPVNHAVRLHLKSEMAGANEELWLVERHPTDPSANRVSMGAAVLELRSEKESSDASAETSPKVPLVKITQKSTGKVHHVALEPFPTGEIVLGDSGLKLSGLRYLPDARVNESMELVSVSDAPRNPAVEFTVTDAQGQKESHTRFALFPEFESLHGKTRQDLFGLSVELSVPSAHADNGSRGASLAFYPGQPWSYTSRSSRGKTEGPVEAGQSYPAGWMDFSFTVDELLDRAVIAKKIVRAEEGAKNRIAADVSVEKDGRSVVRQWVFPDQPLKLDTEKGPVVIAIGGRSREVPFSLTLKDFRKVDYPGTSSPASFESDVILEDTRENVAIHKTISMNKPLDYKGYRIFQSSYSQDPGAGEMSIFTVAKNPGIFLIYSGSIVMFLGVILVFYVEPFSSLAHWRSHSHASKHKKK